MQYALHGYTQNLPDFRPKPSSRDFSGRMQYAPTRVRAKFNGFHISAHDMTQNPPGFRPKPSSQDISGRMLLRPTRDTPKSRPVLHPNRRRGAFRGVCFCAPTRVRAKPARFHISAHGYAKNPSGFRPKPSSQDISGRMQYAPTRVHEKPVRFHIFPIGIRPNPAQF